MASLPRKLLACGCIKYTTKVFSAQCRTCGTKQAVVMIVRGVDNVPDVEARIAEVRKARASEKRWRQARRAEDLERERQIELIRLRGQLTDQLERDWYGPVP